MLSNIPGQGNSFSDCLNTREREFAVRKLSESWIGLRASVEGLSDAEWRFRPDQSVWSIGEVVEHLTATERANPRLIASRLLKSERIAATRETHDDSIQTRLLNRTTKAQSPELLRPKRGSPEIKEIHEFEKSRAKTIEYVLSTRDELRHHSAPHPGLGEIDGYQWILFLAAHTERHTAQIEEVKGKLKSLESDRIQGWGPTHEE